MKKTMDVVETRLIPLLKTLADATYQELVWFQQALPGKMDSYQEFCEYFFDTSEAFLRNNNEDYLNEKNKQLLKDLYEAVNTFYDSWGELLEGNIHSLITHPDWIKIQTKAGFLLEALKDTKQGSSDENAG